MLLGLFILLRLASAEDADVPFLLETDGFLTAPGTENQGKNVEESRRIVYINKEGRENIQNFMISSMDHNGEVTTAEVQFEPIRRRGSDDGTKVNPVCVDYSGEGYYPSRRSDLLPIPNGYISRPPSLSVCELERLHHDCVNRVNMYRSGELKFSDGTNDSNVLAGLAPFKEKTGDHKCSSHQALGDQVFLNKVDIKGCQGAHNSNLNCGDPTKTFMGQNSCCTWYQETTYVGIRDRMYTCLQAMWNEGIYPGQKGHWQAMRSTTYTHLSCGFSWAADGHVTINQDFGTADAERTCSCEGKRPGDSDGCGGKCVGCSEPSGDDCTDADHTFVIYAFCSGKVLPHKNNMRICTCEDIGRLDWCDASPTLVNDCPNACGTCPAMEPTCPNSSTWPSTPATPSPPTQNTPTQPTQNTPTPPTQVTPSPPTKVTPSPPSGTEGPPGPGESDESVNAVCVDYTVDGHFPKKSHDLEDVPADFVARPTSLSVCELEKLHQECVARINNYRTGELTFKDGSTDSNVRMGLKPLKEKTGDNQCSSHQALGDLVKQHSSSKTGCWASGSTDGSCPNPNNGKRAQNNCCVYHQETTYEGVLEKMLKCIDEKWNEGNDPKAHDSEKEAWRNMRSTEFEYVSCGFAWSDSGYVLMNQDFSTKDVDQECSCEGKSSGDSDGCGNTCQGCSEAQPPACTDAENTYMVDPTCTGPTIFSTSRKCTCGDLKRFGDCDSERIQELCPKTCGSCKYDVQKRCPVPTPPTEATPTPPTQATPTPPTEATPTPPTEVTPTPATEVTPTPATEVTPIPATEVTPTPGTEVTPTPASEETPRPPESTTIPTPKVACSTYKFKETACSDAGCRYSFDDGSCSKVPCSEYKFRESQCGENGCIYSLDDGSCSEFPCDDYKFQELKCKEKGCHYDYSNGACVNDPDSTETSDNPTTKPPEQTTESSGCAKWTKKKKCINNGCTWNKASKTCGGEAPVATCSSHTKKNKCRKAGCTWSGGACA